tara:strand:+ start:612 stop:1121 length:510 start_codon:yes stop_codon:yes gene_type:complete
MNIFFITLFIFVLIYLILNWFVKASSAKISKSIRTFTIILSVILAVIMAFAGRYIFSLPFLLMILPLIKTKAGFTLLQLVRFWGLIKILKNSRRFNFNNMSQNLNSQSISRDEAYKILNLKIEKKYTKNEIMNSYKKIMKKIHPDISPELSRLASIVNEAKEIVLKDLS